MTSEPTFHIGLADIAVVLSSTLIGLLGGVICIGFDRWRNKRNRVMIHKDDWKPRIKWGFALGTAVGLLAVVLGQLIR